MTLAELGRVLSNMPNVFQATRQQITAAGMDDVRPEIQRRAIALGLKMHEVETEMAELFADAAKPSKADSCRSRLKAGEGSVVVAHPDDPPDINPDEDRWNLCKVCRLVVPIDARTRYVGGGDPIHEGCLVEIEGEADG